MNNAGRSPGTIHSFHSPQLHLLSNLTAPGGFSQKSEGGRLDSLEAEQPALSPHLDRVRIREQAGSALGRPMVGAQEDLVLDNHAD